MIHSSFQNCYNNKKHSRDEKIIARAVTQLRESGHRKISRGVYTIPFEFALPASLPSSTQFPKADTRAFNGRLKVRVYAYYD